AEPVLVRARRWVRKHRVLASSTLAAVLVARLLGTAGGGYWREQRQRARGEAEAGLLQVGGLGKGHRRGDAEAMLEQVGAWVGQAADSPLREKLAQAEIDLTLARDLDRVRQEAATLVAGKWNPNRVRILYLEVLSRQGLDVLEGDLDEL